MLDTVTVMLKEKIMFLEKPDRIHFHTFDAGDDGTGQILDLMRLVIAVFCLLYTSPSPRDATLSRMPSSA